MLSILWAIFLALLVLGGVAIAAFTNLEFGRRIGAGVAGVGVLLWAMSSVNYVGPTDVGVKISLGKVAERSVPSGVHVNAPWTSIETLPKRPLTTEDVTVKARTSEGGSVAVRSAARWHTNETDAASLYLQVRTGDEASISQSVVDKFLGQAIGNTYAKYSNADALNKRTEAERDLNAALQTFLKPYGIVVDSVFLREVEPDEATARAVSRLTAQANETKIATESVETAKQVALAKVEAAKGIKNAAGELPAGLTPLQVQALCIQAWTDAVNKALSAGRDVYTQPCSGTSVLPAASVGSK